MREGPGLVLLEDIVIAAGAGAAGAGADRSRQSGLPQITPQYCLNFVTSMFCSGMPFDQFDVTHRHKSLADISGGRLKGPGDRRRVGGLLLAQSTARADAAMGEVVGHALTVSCSIDGLVDTTGKVVYNVMTRAVLRGFFSAGGSGGVRREPVLPPPRGSGHPAGLSGVSL